MSLRQNQTIRKARATEAKLLSDLALRSKAYWDYSDEFIESCRDELTFSSEDLAKHHFFVLEVSTKEGSNSIVGFYQLVQLSNQEIELDALFVKPKHIGKGYGRLLIEHAKSEAQALGAVNMLIQGDPNAKKFYEAVGGILIGEKQSGSITGRYLPLFRIKLVG